VRIVGRALCFLNAWKTVSARTIQFASSTSLSTNSNLAELGFGWVDPEATGRPSYHPSVLLKLYI
jgi:hypothetical protein